MVESDEEEVECDHPHLDLNSIQDKPREDEPQSRSMNECCAGSDDNVISATTFTVFYNKNNGCDRGSNYVDWNILQDTEYLVWDEVDKEETERKKEVPLDDDGCNMYGICF